MYYRVPCLILVLALVLLVLNTSAQMPGPSERLGDDVFTGWSGLALDRTSGSAWLRLGEKAVFREHAGPRGWFKHGFRVEHDGTVDWRKHYGLRFEARTKASNGARITVILTTPKGANADTHVLAEIALAPGDWQEITLPWNSFAFEQARPSFLKWIQEVSLRATVPIELRRVAVIRGDLIALQTPVRGKAGVSRGVVEYAVSIGNTTDREQSVTLTLDRYGWEALSPTVTPAALTLAPGETKVVTVRVGIPGNVPSGARERQVLRAVANGAGARAATLELVTAVAVARPNILHTRQGWQEVREKVKKYEWARTAQMEFIERAENWRVPEIAEAPRNDNGDGSGPYLFSGGVYDHEKSLVACGVAWQLSREKKYAEKAALFLRRLSDPGRGYPVTLRGCSQGLVQEGHFFQHIAMTYDMILDAGILGEEDRAQIERTFRAYIETIDFEVSKGAINNWNLSEVCGAFYCALAMQDLAAAERFFSGPSGIKDQLAKGTMDDGWWYECSVGYNIWCASEFVQAALAYEPWGYNFRDEKVPANLSNRVLLSAELSGGNTAAEGDKYAQKRPFGMSAELWGPNRRPYREIRDLWNSLLPFLDWRGVMFGVNDSTETSVINQRIGAGFAPFEMAYYAFRDPAYAALVRLSPTRDLLYGVPELPEETPKRFRDSAFADNVGLAMLRSQTPGRPVREQIQAALHYGIHGWAHGHFDRTSLVSLMRYGRSFYNPEAVWYVYEPFMYKFYTQNSVAKNMVVVDRKLQESIESDRLLFHTGQAMQAAVVQTETRWSNPPYGGMVYDYVPVKTFAEKQWREGRSVPNPEDPPVYGSLTDFTEKVLQRRLMVVTDDYVLLADYVKGGDVHNYEALFQMKGFRGLEAAEKKFLRHEAQWDTNPLGSAQFVTDVEWYAVRAPAKSRFDMRWGAGADNAGNRTPHSEDGLLALEVHSLWPLQQEIMIGTVPEHHDTEKRLFYAVRTGSQTLAEGRFGAWILGKAEVDVSLEGLAEFDLETRVEISRKPTVFWGNARIVMSDGSEVPLAGLKTTSENVVPVMKSNRDYFGGPVKIAGQNFDRSTPAQPKDEKASARVRVDLRGLTAMRFKATLGSDYPLGDESQRRKTYAVRAAEGKEARFLTVIEPHEGVSVVRSAVALDANRVHVELADGRVQEITLNNFEGDGRDIRVTLVETKDGREIRRESTTH